MPIIDNGLGPYVPREDGTKDYGTCNEFKINDTPVILFDAKTGILQLSASPETCLLFAEINGVSEFEPKDITITLFNVMRFPKVKQIVSLPKKRARAGISISVKNNWAHDWTTRVDISCTALKK